MPLMIPKHLATLLPRGLGNKEIAAVAPFRDAASGVVQQAYRVRDGVADRTGSRRCAGRAARNEFACIGKRTRPSPPVLLSNTSSVGLGGHTRAMHQSS
jgi:hypothetical protein